MPRPKPAYSLEFEDDCDYEASGIVEESENEDGDADAVDIEGGRDDDHLFEGGRDDGRQQRKQRRLRLRFHHRGLRGGVFPPR